MYALKNHPDFVIKININTEEKTPKVLVKVNVYIQKHGMSSISHSAFFLVIQKTPIRTTL